VKASGFSLAQSIASAVFGGFTPAICTYLIQRTGNPASLGLWLSFTAARLAATFLCRRVQAIARLEATPALTFACADHTPELLAPRPRRDAGPPIKQFPRRPQVAFCEPTVWTYRPLEPTRK
jgi:hypothetical protein